MMCWSVPCFMMITGALLLKKDKNLTVKACLNKYARRIALVLLLFGIPFALMTILFETKTLVLRSVLDAVLAVLQEQSWDHLWYLYTLFGAYLLLPILKKFTDNCTQSELLYACGLLLFFDCVIPILNAAIGIKIAFTVWMPLKPCYYILAGHYLSKYSPKIKPWMSAVVSIITLSVLWIFKGFETSEVVSALQSCLVVIVSTAVFLTFTTLRVTAGEKLKQVLWHIDRLCFGVYLVHPVFINLVYRFFKLTPVNFGDNIFAILLFFVEFTVTSFAASWIMNLIKPLRKYVL